MELSRRKFERCSIDCLIFNKARLKTYLLGQVDMPESLALFRKETEVPAQTADFPQDTVARLSMTTSAGDETIRLRGFLSTTEIQTKLDAAETEVVPC